VREVSTTGGKFTLAEVAEHNTLDDLWLAVDGKVFDITKFAADHPGGKEVLELYAGQDGSAEFNMIHHPDIIRKYGRVYEIGDVVEDHTDWTVPETEEELADRLAAYKEDGFTIFRGLSRACTRRSRWSAGDRSRTDWRRRQLGCSRRAGQTSRQRGRIGLAICSSAARS